ncbi:MAG: hypothetical protein IH948_06525 [Bacteroidetes bacterium]|nr:hypothetical protein [Bacteroidota bacterium]
MLKISEYFWLIVSIAGVCISPYKIYTRGIGESYIFLIATFVAILMYVLRRMRRTSLEKKE